MHAAFTIFFDAYKFLKSLFDIIEFSLDNSVDIYEEFLLLLNNKDIFQKICEHKKCVLNTHQKDFIISNKFKIEELDTFLKELKAKEITNDELLKELNDIDINKKSQKKKKKSSKQNTKNNISASNTISNDDDESKHYSTSTNNDDINKTKETIIKISDSNYDSKDLKDKERDYLIERIKLIEKEIEDLKKANDNLTNRLDICETKINMICYRDLIKDIINYSFEYFNVSSSLGKNLWSKVIGIKRSLKYSKDKMLLSNEEKEIFSGFIYFSFLTLKNVNHNVHDGEEGYVSDYSKIILLVA